MRYEVGTIGTYPKELGFDHVKTLTREEALKQIAAAAPNAEVGVRRQTAAQLLQMDANECRLHTKNRVFVITAIDTGVAYAAYFKNGNWFLVSKSL